MREINLTVAPGATCALVGANGAGKTTFLRILAGILRPTCGQFKCATDSVSYMPQTRAVHSELRLPEFWGACARLRPGWSRDKAEALAYRFGLTPGTRISAMSRGQQAQAVFAATIAAPADLVLLDEPTAGFDIFAREVYREALLAAKESGRSMIISSHELDEIEKCCDQVVLLARGTIVGDGSLVDLVAAHPGCSFDEIVRRVLAPAASR
ncbi:MAG: ATP-binding cassette domain-containing protein [Candidatus Dormibacteria bacterium]